MSNDIKIKISIDGKDSIATLKGVSGGLENVGKISESTRRNIDLLAHSFQAFTGISQISSAFFQFAKSGIEANRTFENLKIQLTGLISANSSNVSMLGKSLDATQKWQLGLKESERILNSLNQTNAKTKFTLEEITGAFNMFYATSAGQGGRDKAVKAMDSIALAAQAVGKNLRDLTPMMDSLATGTVVAASEMGSFMKIVGLTNEELKKASEGGRVYDLIIEKLAKFKEMSEQAASGYDVAMGNLQNELQSLSRELSRPMFDTLTSGINSFSKFLSENKDTLVSWGQTAGDTARYVGVIGGSFAVAKVAAIALTGATSALKAAFGVASGASAVFASSLNVSLTASAALQRGLAMLNAAFSTLLPVATIYLLYEAKDAISALNGKLEGGAQSLNTVQKWIYRLVDALTTQLQIAQVKIYQFINDLKIMGLKAKQFFSELNAEYNPFSDGEGAEKIKKDIALLEKYNKGYGELIEKYKKDAVSRELNLQGFKTGDAGQIIVGAGKAKEKVDELQNSVRKLGTSSGNVGKKDLSALKSALKEIAEVDFSDIETKTQRAVDRYNEMLSLGVGKAGAQRYLDSNLARIANEHLEQAKKEEQEELDRRISLQSEYYKTVGDMESAWQIERAQIIKKYDNLLLKDGEKLTKEQLDKLLKIEENTFKQGSKIAKNSFGDIKNSWSDTVSTMAKSVEEGFFNFFIGKTKSLKTALKDIGTNLFRDLISPYARSLSQGISGGFASMLGGGSNLAQIASYYGLSKNDEGGFSGTINDIAVKIASDGTITQGNAAFGGSSNIISMISNLKSAYSMLSSGYTGLVSSFTTVPAGYLANYLSSMGFSGGYFGLSGLGAGMQHALTGNLVAGGGLNGSLSGVYSGAYAGGAAIGGAALGYGIGILGDKLFKADTYASTGGALGGAAGGLVAGMKAGSSMGPWGAVIGAVAGALIGGAFGKKKVTASGLAVLQEISAGDTLSNQNIRSYVDMQKKGWFSKKSWTEYSDLDADTMSELQKQISSVNRLAMRAGALSTLKIAANKYSNDSFGDTGIAKAIIKSMTGQEDKVWAEVIESGGKKRKGLLNKISNVFEKVMKFSPSSIVNKALEPVDKAVGNVMKGSFLGRIHEESIKWRKEIGNIGDGNTFGSEGAKSIDKMLNLTEDVKNKNLKLIDNPELERMYKDWQELAKKENKKIIELMSQSLGAIGDTYKNLEAMSENNALKQAQISMRQTFESFIDSAQALKVKIPENLADITELSVERMTLAYHEAIANDFTKANIDGLNGLIAAYKAAKEAQEAYTKSVINFTQSIAQTQGGLYQTFAYDTNILSLQNIYTKFRALLGSTERDIDEKTKKGVNKYGTLNDVSAWADYFYNISAQEMQQFLSSGNTEARNSLVGLVAEFKTLTNSNGGRGVWLKAFSDLEALNAQISALKLAEQAENALKIQREQLSVLNAQKSVIEKIANIQNRLRESVLDNATSTTNYRFALERAVIAFQKNEYDSKAYDELNTATTRQAQYLKDTSVTYADYKIAMLKMADELKYVTGGANIDDINRQIKRLDMQLGGANNTLNSQLEALKSQKDILKQSTEHQIHAMATLWGADSPIVSYLKEVLEALMSGKAIPEFKGEIPNLSNGTLTANGALLSSQADKEINEIYKTYLGRSVEQSGLEAWRKKAQIEGLSKEQLKEQIISTAKQLIGSTDKNAIDEWNKKHKFKAFAEGGIVTRPTRALIGEAGYPEAVLPLKDGRGVKVDMDGAFDVLVNRVERLERVSASIDKNIREMNMRGRDSNEDGFYKVRIAQ